MHRLLQATGMSRASTPHLNISNLCVVTSCPNTRGALFRSSLPAVASAPVAVRMGQIQAD